MRLTDLGKIQLRKGVRIGNPSGIKPVGVRGENAVMSYEFTWMVPFVKALDSVFYENVSALV